MTTTTLRAKTGWAILGCPSLFYIPLNLVRMGTIPKVSARRVVANICAKAGIGRMVRHKQRVS